MTPIYLIVAWEKTPKLILLCTVLNLIDRIYYRALVFHCKGNKLVQQSEPLVYNVFMKVSQI